MLQFAVNFRLDARCSLMSLHLFIDTVEGQIIFLNYKYRVILTKNTKNDRQEESELIKNWVESAF